jgi:ferric-dicitrate binding protein FerR (iron transport regulator)
MDRATELIERYLDDIATEAERAELAALLAADSSVADTLARAARADARLRHLGASGQAPQAPRRAAARPAAALWRSWRVCAAAAGVLIVLGGLLGALLLFATRPTEPPFQIVSGRVDRAALETPLEVGGDTPAMIRLAGGAQAELSRGTRFVLHPPAAQRGTRVALLVGAGMFSVPADSGAITVDTPGDGSVTGQGAAFTVRVDTSASGTGPPEWVVTVSVAQGVVEARHAKESSTLTSSDSKIFRVELPADLVGLVEGVSTAKQQQVINGVEKLLVETRLSLAIRGGSAAAIGSRVTVRLTDATRSAGAAGPSLGNVVRIWLAPGTRDLANYVDIAQE